MIIEVVGAAFFIGGAIVYAGALVAEAIRERK